METFNNYIWLVSILYRAGDEGLTLDEINEKWQNNDIDSEPITQQTLVLWTKDIFDIMDIIIECYDNCHYYVYNEPNSLNKCLLEAFNTFIALSQHMSLAERVVTTELPLRNDHLATILNAMSNGKVVSLTCKCQPYADPIEVSPYCVKHSHEGWQLLARDTDTGRLSLYRLDAIEDLFPSTTTFSLPPDFEVDKYFAACSGIDLYAIDRTRIVVRAYKEHQQYIRSLPLHRSQKEIFTSEEYTDFELYLRPTPDFYTEVLTHGTHLEILEPQVARSYIRSHIQNLYNLYK